MFAAVQHRRWPTVSLRDRVVRSRLAHRRGFNLVEMLMALGISAALLTATLVALDASFMAYQRTTETASTHCVARMTMHRMLTLIRTGDDFGPFPTNPLDTTVTSDLMEFITPDGQVMTIEWIEADEALYVTMTDPNTGVDNTNKLLDGVKAQYDADTGDRIKPFTLEYERGRHLHRATIDLLIEPDDSIDLQLEGVNQETIRLVASAMPRLAAYDE